MIIYKLGIRYDIERYPWLDIEYKNVSFKDSGGGYDYSKTYTIQTIF